MTTKDRAATVIRTKCRIAILFTVSSTVDCRAFVSGIRQTMNPGPNRPIASARGHHGASTNSSRRLGPGESA